MKQNWQRLIENLNLMINSKLVQRSLSLRFWLVLIVLPISLSGCKTINSQGQYVSDRQVAQINKSKMNSKQVLNSLGSPTFRNDFSNNKWYYVHRSVKSVPILPPKLLEQRIVSIEFDKKDIATAKIEKLYEDRNVKISQAITKSESLKTSWSDDLARHLQASKKTKNRKKIR